MALTKPQGDMQMKHATEQASTSGTAIDFTGIPAGTTQIFVHFVGVSHNGVAGAVIALQLGDSGGIENTSYNGCAGVATTTPSVTISTNVTSFSLTNSVGAAGVHHGIITLTLEDPTDNTWTCSVLLGRSDASTVWGPIAAGSKSLSGTLDRVRVFIAAGNNFDAGVVGLSYF